LAQANQGTLGARSHESRTAIAGAYLTPLRNGEKWILKARSTVRERTNEQ
jgi:hypothetical protein